MGKVMWLCRKIPEGRLYRAKKSPRSREKTSGERRKQTCNNLTWPISGARSVILVKRRFISSRYSINVLKYLLNESDKPVFFYSVVYTLKMQLVCAACFLNLFLEVFIKI